MNLNPIFKYAKAKNISSLEINIKKHVGVDIEVHNDKLKKYETSNTTNYLIKAFYQNKTLKYECEDIKNYKEIIDEIINDASILEEETKENISSKENIVSMDKHTLSNKVDQKLLYLLSINQFISENEFLTDIEASYGESITEIDIYTMDNIHKHDSNKIYYFTSEIFAKKDTTNSSTFVLKESVNDDIDIISLIKNGIKDALAKLDCQDIPSGKYKVLLTNEVSSNILEAFIQIFSASTIQKNISLLNGKKDTKVFSDKLTIIEDPCNPNFIGKRLFDEEGTKTYRKEIIKDGVFQTILYDNNTALKDNTVSSGNAYGSISTRNLYIKEGQYSFEDLQSQMNNGIIINAIQGMHAGINQTNGDISLQGEGYYVENGQITHPIKLFVLVTNIFELYQNIIAIGSDLDFFNSKCGSPSLLIDNIQISK